MTASSTLFPAVLCHSAGSVGNTLEDLLGVRENNVPLADAGIYEIKTQRQSTMFLTTLFHFEPKPRKPGIVSEVYLPHYGWAHETIPKERSFRVGVVFSEAFVLSRKLGMDRSTFINVFNKTAQKNYYLESRGPGIIRGDYAPPSFTANMLLKDLTLAERQSAKYRAALPAAGIATQMFTSCVDQGYGEMDISDVAKVIEDLNGIKT